DVTLSGILQSTAAGAGAISIDGNLALAGNSSILTAGSDITIDGVVTGAKTLTLTAGAGDIAVNNSGSLPDAIGTSATPLLGFTTSGATLALNGNVWVSGAMSLRTTAGG